MEKQIQELYNPLFFYIKKRINSQEDAEDITQEVFLKLSRSNDRGIENLKSWVYTIAKNTISDFYKKKRIITEDVDGTWVEEEYNDNNAVQELGNCIAAYVDKLPNEYKDIVRLSELEEVSQKDIAQRLGINYVTVRSKVQRGRKKLKDIFSRCCTVEQGVGGSILGYSKKEPCQEGGSDCSQETGC